jgi:hypothetical protein
LIMLKLSGWLRANAFCRVARAGIRSRARGAGGGVGGCAVRGMHREGLGCGGRGEGAHTLNILFMFTTFDVSRLSGWLKVDAPCRVARGRAYEAEECAGREGREGGGWAAAVLAACREGLGWRLGEGMHLKHAFHVRDLIGFPAGNVRVEAGQVSEDAAHVGDARDVPAAYGAVLQFGGGHVGVVINGGRPQFGIGRKDAKQAAVVSGWPGGVGGQEHRQPLRRDRDRVVGLRQLARHTGLGHVREEGGAEGGGDADEDEHAEARSVLPRLYRLRWGDLEGSTVQGMGDGAVWNAWGEARWLRQRESLCVLG